MSSTSSPLDDGKNQFGYPTPASPDNPHLFQRVPWNNRVHWLNYWNPKHDPHALDCTLAFNTLAYCQSPLTQIQHRYDEGTLRSCVDEFNAIRTCMRTKAMANRDYTKAKEILESLEEKETEHVLTFRKEPPKKLMQGLLDVSSIQ